jgi:hypothetical protein
MNSFGLYREYPRVPTHDPDITVSLDDLSDIPKPPAAAAALQSPFVPSASRTPENPYYPFPNSTAYGITNWMWSGSPLKSIKEGVKLVAFLDSAEFKKEDMAGFNLVKETERLDQFMSSGVADGWSEISVDIKVLLLIHDRLRVADHIPRFQMVNHTQRHRPFHCTQFRASSFAHSPRSLGVLCSMP